MRLQISVALIAVVLTSCGGGGDSSKVADVPPSAAKTVESSATEHPKPAGESSATNSKPVGESSDCLVAASKWADRMTHHLLDASTTAPALGETLNLDDLDDPTSEIKVLCSGKLSQPVLNGNLKIAEANFKLSLCGFSNTGCTAPLARTVRRLASQDAGIVGNGRHQL
jgi:hypothetical protein